MISRSPWRAVADGAIVAGLIFAAFLFVIVAPAVGTFGFDAYAYWRVDPGDPYGATAGGLGAFTYTPVIARLFDAFGSDSLARLPMALDGLPGGDVGLAGPA